MAMSQFVLGPNRLKSDAFGQRFFSPSGAREDEVGDQSFVN